MSRIFLSLCIVVCMGVLSGCCHNDKSRDVTREQPVSKCKDGHCPVN